MGSIDTVDNLTNGVLSPHLQHQAPWKLPKSRVELGELFSENVTGKILRTAENHLKNNVSDP